MSFGGPGSAFSFAAPTRPSRRVGSASSSSTGGGAQHSTSTATSPTHPSGPTPVDPPANPSHGSWSNGAPSTREREVSSGSLGDSTGSAPRSFSSILSPSLSANGMDGDYQNGNGGAGGGGKKSGGGSKPFVYSRDFLLSLYDDEKASKRPLELAVHEIATRDLSDGETDHKPWAMQDYRPGEKELFSTSIHPANARPSRMNRTESSTNSGSNGTLDLSTLGTLPRDRDRALGSPSLRSPSITSAEIGSGRERRTRERSVGPGSMGIQGGVLGGIAPVANASLSSSGGSKKKDGEASKEVWQGGRWRRGAAQEVEEPEKRTSAFGSRRFPLPDDANGRNDESVPDSWEETTKEESRPTGSSSLNGTLNSSTDSLPNETDLTASVLGSLALDSDPLEDSLLSNKPISASGTATPSRAGPPPGLASVPQPEVNWQYRDPSGQVQGPFPAAMMHDWYRQQFFQHDLRVKRTTDHDFETLADLIRRTGDSEKPFLAPKPTPLVSTAPGSTFSSAPGTPQLSSAWGAPRAQTPLEQLTGSLGQGRFGSAAPGGGGGAATSSSFYEPFGSNAGSPAVQPQTLPQLLAGRNAATPGGSALDPWGAPLPAVASPFQQLFPQQGQQHASLQSPLLQHGIPNVDVLRQLAQQQQQQFQQGQSPSFAPQYGGHLPGTDVFGRPSPLPTPSYFDPRQLVHGSPAQQQAPTAWIGQQAPQQQQYQQQQQQQQQPQQQQPWSNEIGTPAQQPSQNAAPSPVPQSAASSTQAPIGPPAESAPAQQQAQPKVEVAETVVVETAPAKEPEVVAVVEEVTVAQPEPVKEQPQVKSKKAKKEAKSTPAAPPAVESSIPSSNEPEQSAPSSPSPSPSVTSSSKAPAAAPWAKEEVASPVGNPAGPSPSLREIQQAEAREAEKRKAAARIQAAQASIQAAQRAAAAEAALAAEQLPSSANWAAGPAQVPAVKPAVAAPWTKPVAAPAAKANGGKTLKEIQEEEEKRKKAQLAAQQQAQASTGFVGKGYAASATKGNAATSSPWTTVAVKPAVVHAAPTAKSIIPGLPSAGSVVVPATRPSATTAPSSASKPSAPPTAVRPAAVSTPSASSVVSKPSSIIRSINVNGASSNAPAYDAENPPPPSAEFVAWIRQALKGLQVPMDEFIQVLLSFPLDASSDVLEIISDSVYANSSTLDGRRFANDYATRRKNDVAVRYPQIFAAKGKVAAKGQVSMAQALANQPQQKQTEWSVKVSGGKKKKGSK